VVSSGDRAHDDRSGTARSSLGDDRGIPDLLRRASWRKSSYSTYNGACVGVAELHDDLIGVRDTKDHDVSRALLFSKADWRAFLAGLKQDEPGHRP
jgi:hypothetical protein